MRSCIHCGGKVEPRKTIMANGEVAVSLFCPACNLRATKDPWISKAEYAAEIDDMPIENDYRGSELCGYDECENPAVEKHHYAPRQKFGDDCDNWPIGPLCRIHHRTWHATMEGDGMRKCPKCGQVSNASAIVDTFPEPREWQFYGQPGHRVIRCRGMVDGKYFVHFVVTEKGRAYHRIAYGMKQEVKL